MNQIVGHEHILAMLERTALKNTPAHTYLFTGCEGIGKKQVALRFMRRLNCPESRKDEEGECRVCRRITDMNHPDVRLVRPERGSIRIDQVRAIHNFFKFPPSEAAWRICLIDDAHLLNRAAQNALLKTMEEPPASRILFLVTSKPYVLLPTVRSRCRRIRFGALSNASVVRILQESKRMTQEQAIVLASISGGSVREALRLNTPTFVGLRAKLIGTLGPKGAAAFTEVMEISASISADPETAKDAIGISISWMRDILLVQSFDETARVINQDSLPALRGLAERFSARQILAAYDELVKTLLLIDSEINVNRNLAVDVMFLKLATIFGNPIPDSDTILN